MKNVGIALISVGLFLVVKVFTVFLMMVGLDLFYTSVEEQPSKALIAAVATIISSLVLLLIFYFWKPLSDLVDRWRSLSVGYVLACLTLGWIGLGLNSFMLSAVMDNQAESYSAALPLLEAGTLGLIGTVILVPIIEELVFRRMMIGSLSRVVHPYVAILISAIVFGALHGESVQILGATVIGLILGWLYYQSKSLLPSTLLHIFNNGLFMVILKEYSEEGAAVLDTEVWSFSFVNPYGIYIFVGIALLFGLLAKLVYKMSLNMDELQSNN